MLTAKHWKLFFQEFRRALALTRCVLGRLVLLRWLLVRMAGSSFNADAALFLGPLAAIGLLSYMRRKGDILNVNGK